LTQGLLSPPGRQHIVGLLGTVQRPSYSWRSTAIERVEREVKKGNRREIREEEIKKERKKKERKK